MWICCGNTKFYSQQEPESSQVSRDTREEAFLWFCFFWGHKPQFEVPLFQSYTTCCDLLSWSFFTLFVCNVVLRNAAKNKWKCSKFQMSPVSTLASRLFETIDYTAGDKNTSKIPSALWAVIILEVAYLLRSLIMRFWNSDEMPLLKLGRDSSRSVCLSWTLSVWWLGCLCRCGLRKAMLMSLRRRGKGPSLMMASCGEQEKENELCCGFIKKKKKKSVFFFFCFHI